MATSIIDYIFRELAITYLERKDLSQVQQEDLRMDSMKKDDQDPECVAEEADMTALRKSSILTEHLPVRNGLHGNGHGNGAVAHKLELKRETLTMTSILEEAKRKGFEGDPCPECKQFMMVRNGTCLKCTGCGATSGCS
jgi:ribonucleoside-diphosphate reductase alpha chain